MNMGVLKHCSQIMRLPNQISQCSGDHLYTFSSRFEDSTFSTDLVATPASPEPLAFPKRSDWHKPPSTFLDEIAKHDQDAHEIKIATPEPEHEPEPEPEPSEPTVLTNYDVLFATPFFSTSPHRKDSEYTLINHVGNRRFLVLINIYRPRYIAAAEQDDQGECLRIVLEIIKTIRQQCEPNGRFLQQDANSTQWLEIDEVAILVRIVAGELTKFFHSSEDREQPAKRARTGIENSFGPRYHEAAKKKKFPHEGSLVGKPKPFDVICNITSLSLQENANHVGNNRLQVIMDIRFNDFQSSTHEDRNIIVQDIVNSIIDDSSSQFLSVHVSSGTYMPLSRETAAMCIKNALDSKLVISSEADQLVSRYYKKRLLGEVERRNNVVSKLPMSPTLVVPKAA